MPALDPSNPGQVHVWVQDHGIGIALDDQKKIFQQYFRTDAAKEIASKTVLGLNRTKSLVELREGSI
jgi:signal transduction histidine kinase